MKNREYLKNLIKESELSKSELKKKFYPYLVTRHDIKKLKSIVEEILKGNINNISSEDLTDKDIIALIQLLGGQVQKIEDKEIKEINIEENEELLEIEKQEKPIREKDEISKLTDLYNTTLVKNAELETKLEQKDEVIEQQNEVIKELREQQEEILNKLNKFERIIDKFQKYNITETGVFVEVEDNDINELYRDYLIEETTKLNNAILFENEGHIIIPKIYYKKEVD
jgi:DNA repair exonuclease SbcCD ATPase subunit